MYLVLNIRQEYAPYIVDEIEKHHSIGSWEIVKIDHLQFKQTNTSYMKINHQVTIAKNEVINAWADGMSTCDTHLSYRPYQQ